MTRIMHVLVFVFGLSAVSLTPTIAEEVKLGTYDYVLLMGTWNGTYISKSSDGKVRFKSDVELTIVESGIGTISLSANDRQWESTVVIKSGAVTLQIDRADRKFVYERQDDAATLSATYKSKFQGYPRKVEVVLTKKGALSQ